MQLQAIQSKIFEIRHHKVMLDIHLAELYQVETRVLKQAVKRNLDLFPDDFMFQLTRLEVQNLTSQFVISSSEWGGSRYLPFAFTEHGVTMVANILKSKKARQTVISIVRAFIGLKQFVINYKELSEKLKEMEGKYNRQFKDVHDAINYLLQKDKQQIEQKKRKKIGFKVVKIKK